MVQEIVTKTILSPNKFKDNWFGTDYTMNLYRGCCHGCIYCDSRSECYHNDEFDIVKVKQNCLSILEKELRSKRRSGVVGSGAMTDPYNPFEKELEVSRGSLALLDRYGFGAATVTKGDMIVRDIDLFRQIHQHSPVICKITITAADDAVAQQIEPFSPSTSKRFEAVRKLSQAGLFTGILLMPVLPWITDQPENIRKLIALAKENGAQFVYCSFGMTMRDRQREYYYQQLDKRFPGLKEKYERKFKERYNCACQNPYQLYHLLQQECNQAGLLYKMKDIIAAYRLSRAPTQISLFP